MVGALTYRPAQDLPMTAFGDLRTAQLSPIMQGTFEYTVDNTELNENVVVGTGTVTQAQAMALVASGATAGGTAFLQSTRHARYRAGFGGLSRFTARFTAPVAGTEQLIGLAGDSGVSTAFDNGYMVGYIGTTFGFHRFVNDTLVSVALADWDDPLDGTGDSGMILVPTNLNVFFIQFEYLGAGPINIWVQSGTTKEAFIAHTVDYANANLTPSVFNPNFHHTMWANNGTAASDVIVRSSSYGFFVEGITSFIELHQPIFGSGSREKTTVTTEVAIFTIRNKSTYVSKTNFIDILIEALGASIEASSPNNLGTVRVVKNTTLGGVPSYADINASDSVVEIDTAGTTLTGGVEVFSVSLAGKNDKVNEIVEPLKLILKPGDTLTVAGLSANSATIDADMLWKELF